MRQVARKGLITVMAAGGVLAVSGGYAHADSGARGGASGSPGVLSGNTIQAPVDVPVNACGNSVNVGGLLNPASGNDCENGSGGNGSGGDSGSRSGRASGGSQDSPGVGSGNTVQAPVDVPVNLCGNSVSVGGLGNSTTGNDCGGAEKTQPPAGQDQSDGRPASPAPSDGSGGSGSKSHTPDAGPMAPGGVEDRAKGQQRNEARPHQQIVTPPLDDQQLARTGVSALGVLAPSSAALLGAGVVIYRRAQAANSPRG